MGLGAMSLPTGKRRIWLIAIAVAAFVVASAAVVWAAYSGPTYQFVTVDMVDSDRPTITVRVFGSGHMYFPSTVHPESIQMKVNGVSVPFELSGHPTQRYLTYVPPTSLPARSTNTVWVTATDEYGTTTASDTFYVTAIDEESRLPIAADSNDAKTWIDDPRQPFLVKLFNTANTSSVAVTLDGAAVVHTYNSGTRTVSYTPATNLSLGAHTIVVTCNDLWGRVSSTSWSVNYSTPSGAVGTDGPIFGNVSPSDGAEASPVPSTYRLTLTGYLTDSDGLANKTTTGYLTSSSGAKYSFNAATSYPWYGDGLSGTISATLGHSGPWPEDTYEAYVITEDALGNQTEKTWSFNIWADDPELINETPSAGAAVSVARPAIGVVACDMSSGIDPDSIVMTVDGATVTPTLTVYEGIGGTGFNINYLPPADLLWGGHTVRVECLDGAGRPAELEWDFINQEAGTGPMFLGMTTSGTTRILVDVADADGVDAASGSLFMRQNGQEWYPSSTAFTEYAGTDGTFGYLNAYITTAGEGVQEVVAEVADSTGATSTAVFYTSRNMAPPVVAPRYDWSPPGYITDPLTPVRARITDAASQVDTASIEFRVNDVTVPVAISVVDTLTVDVEWTTPAPMDEALQSFELDVADVLGNATTRAWTADVRIPPTFVSATPDNGETLAAGLSGATIEVVYDDITGVETSTVEWLIDGNEVTPAIQVDGDRHTFTHTWDAGEGLHSSVISLQDVRGGATTKAWTFNVDVGGSDFADMDVPENNVCLICHVDADESGSIYGYRGTRGTSGGFSETHRIRAGVPNASHVSSCQSCHQYDQAALTTPVVEDHCDACHLTTTDAHGPQWDYTVSWIDDPALYDVDAPREQFDCMYCHQGISGERIVGHDFRAEHETTLDDECAGCHAGELTREHASAGRTTEGGGSIGCETCHMSAVSAVQNAYTRHPAIVAYGQLTSGNTTAEIVSSTFSVSGEKVVGATMDIHNLDDRYSSGDQYGTIKVDAYIGGAWQEVYSERYMDEGRWKPTPFSTHTTREVSFDPADQVRVRLEFSGADRGPLDVMLSDWQFAQETAVECTTCHTGQDHRTGHTGVFDAECADCHDDNLYVEHIVDRDFECATCHDSVNSAVTAALVAGDTACTACHDNADHVDLHEASLTREPCADCHSANLVIEHVANVGAYCSVCHVGGYSAPVESRTPAPLVEMAAEMAASVWSDVPDDYHTESRTARPRVIGGAGLVQPLGTVSLAAADDFTCGSCHDPEPHGVRDDCDSCHGPLGFSTNESEPPTSTLPIYVDWDASGANAAVATPHKGYSTSTQKCAVCHAVHQASVTGELLLRSKVQSACEYCHIDTNVGTIQIYGGNTDNYWSVASAQAHNRTSESSCTNCHSVHGANTLEGANTTKILHDWPMDGSRSAYSTATLDVWADPGSVADDDEQITAWCSGCHKYYVRSYNTTITTTAFDHQNDYEWEWEATKSHIMTDLAGGYANPAASTTPGDNVAWASSNTCRSCHDAGATDQGAGLHSDSFPHFTEGYYRFMEVADSLASATETNTTGYVDGLCLKCHRPNGGAGVGYDY